MEFNEKLQMLRNEKGLTQEELASVLFVSRTAVSKWESGRGYPNIESLKQIAKIFSVTVDELLSGDKLLSIAEEDKKTINSHYKRLIFGISDIAASLLLFLPLFADRGQTIIKSASLFSLLGDSNHLIILYFGIILCITLLGVLTLLFKSKEIAIIGKISLILSVVGVLLFTAGLHPYAAVFLFIFLTLKVMTTRRIS